jgi:hypothetical protein
MVSPSTSAAGIAGNAKPFAFHCLHTYFLFPFALDREAIQEDHPEAWPGRTRWIDGLDAWIASESGAHESCGIARLGRWKRASYATFDVQSPAYSDLLFFNPVVRRVFFDTNIGHSTGDEENQLRCYSIEISAGSRLWFEGSDALGRGGRAEVKDLRLYLSAQGLGVLSIGIATGAIAPAQALWLNRRLRKLYPVDAESIREGRTPNRVALLLDDGQQTTTLCEERFEHQKMVGLYPPLPATIKSLLYFADYSLEEYEPVLDENMLVYSYAELDTSMAVENGALIDGTIEEFLYFGHRHSAKTPDMPDDGTLAFGLTGHSCSMLRVNSEANSGQKNSGKAISARGIFIVDGNHDALRTFHTRYYLMMIVAIFYRAVLLDFSERSALVSRRLLQDQLGGRLTLASITMVNDLRTEFLNFSSYWHFDDLSCKQADNQLFRRLCAEYKIDEMKKILSSEVGHMGDFVYNYYQLRNTDAVNRLAMLSLIFGGGAVLTGFFGMNFGREFEKVLFEGEGRTLPVHYFMIAVVTLLVFGSLMLGTFVLLRNWRDYLAILNPPKKPRSANSLKRDR